MNCETERLIARLDVSSLSVLEISGSFWRNRFPFRSYKSVDYPAYDVIDKPLSEKFDLIIAEQVWEHLLWPARAARNVKEMLAPGGSFLLTTPFLDNFSEENSGKRRRDNHDKSHVTHSNSTESSLS